MPLIIERTPDDPNRMLRTRYVPEARPNRPRPLGGGRGPRINLRAPYVLGLDLGQASDWTALTVLRPTPEGYELPFLSRTRNRPFPYIVQAVAGVMNSPALDHGAQLILDASGLGRPVLDLFTQTGIVPVPITITGASRATGTLRAARVPRHELINGLLVSLQRGRLKIAADLPLAAELLDELASLRLSFTASGHAQIEPMRANSHDDLVISLAMALWWAERAAGRGIQAEPVAPQPEPERPGAVRRPVAWPEFERWVRDGD